MFPDLYGTANQLDAHADPTVVRNRTDFDQIGMEGWQDLVSYNRVAIEVSCKHLERKIAVRTSFARAMGVLLFLLPLY